MKHRTEFPTLLLALLLFAVSSLTGARGETASVCTRQRVDDYLSVYGGRSYRIEPDAFYESIQESYSVYEREGRHFAGTDAIIGYWNDDPRLIDKRWLAYILATSYHETATRMAPVRETLATSDERAVSILRNDYGKHPHRYANPYWEPNRETGHSYFGRGYVQITHDFNYKTADEQLGVGSRSESYFWNPHLALAPDESVLITYDGMVYGWFTNGRHCLLRHFRPNKRGDWHDARRIINGTNKADDIAEHASKFLIAIDAATVPYTYDMQRPTNAQTSDSVGAVQAGNAALTSSAARDKASGGDDATRANDASSKHLNTPEDGDPSPRMEAVRVVDVSVDADSHHEKVRMPERPATLNKKSWTPPPPVFSRNEADQTVLGEKLTGASSEQRTDLLSRAFGEFMRALWRLILAFGVMLQKLVMLAGLVLIGIWDILVIVCGWIVERATEAHSALNKDDLTVVEPT
ncbi:MAG: glycoside hydrolase family 19 protein [Pseudomonadota bacterium]